MPWRVHSVSTLTWGDRVELDAESFDWTRKFNEGATGSASFRVLDQSVGETATLASTYPIKRALVLSWWIRGTFYPVYVGEIQSADYELDTGVLQVSMTDAFWSMLEHRLMITSRDSGVSKDVLTWSGLALTGYARRIIDHAAKGPAGTTRFPVTVGDFISGSSPERKYYGYDLLTAAEALEAVMEEENGPDVDCNARWSGDQLVFETRTASNLYGGDGLEIDFTAASPGARRLKITTDGTEQANLVAGTGEGTEVDKLVRVSTDSGTTDYPIRESVESFTDIKRGDTLLALTREALRANNQATRQASLEVQVGDPRVDHTLTDVSDLRLGMPVRWNVRHDPYFTDGYRTWNVVQMSGSLDEWVQLEFQEKGG